ncbi:MAG TPA: chloride channel protein, partial [Rhizobium sp.]|nr:chloride channel protein [Rhizobium sp.]
MLNKPYQSPSLASFLDNIRLSRLQALFRRGELGLVALAVCIGISAGLLVSLVRFLSESLHYLIFGVDGTLSGSQVSGIIVLVGPMAGGG